VQWGDVENILKTTFFAVLSILIFDYMAEDVHPFQASFSKMNIHRELRNYMGFLGKGDNFFS